MALTRKALSAMGIEEAQVDQIIEMHADTVNGLKEERDSYKDDAAKYQDTKTELDALKAQIAKDGDTNPYKVKYEAIKEEFDEYKQNIATEKAKASKRSAYRDLLKEAGISEKRIDAVLRVSDYDGVELDEDGRIKDADKLTEDIKEEWSDFIVTKQTVGASRQNPPTNTGGGTQMTKADIMKIKDGAERRKTIAENPELFSQLAAE